MGKSSGSCLFFYTRYMFFDMGLGGYSDEADYRPDGNGRDTPVIIFYLSCQKHIIKGVAAGAVKE